MEDAFQKKGLSDLLILEGVDKTAPYVFQEYKVKINTSIECLFSLKKGQKTTAISTKSDSSSSTSYK